MINLNKSALENWKVFINNQENHGHLNRSFSTKNVKQHITECCDSSRSSALRIQSDIDNLIPKNILEVGCSGGLICYALKDLYPDARIIGIEPEKEAVNLANSMKNNNAGISVWLVHENNLSKSVLFFIV